MSRRENLTRASRLSASLLKLASIVSLTLFGAASARSLRAEDKLDKKVV